MFVRIGSWLRELERAQETRKTDGDSRFKTVQLLYHFVDEAV